MSTSDNSESEEEYKVCPSSYGNHMITFWEREEVCEIRTAHWFNFHNNTSPIFFKQNF